MQVGYVQTLLGRKRAIENINSSDYKLKSKAERQAVNTICQGSAADLMKVIVMMISLMKLISMTTVSNG
jgi:DNA polymerase theta